MKDMDYGKNYRYAHQVQNGYAADETCFPDELGEYIFYEPVPRGLN